MFKLTNNIDNVIVADAADYSIGESYIQGPAIDLTYKVELMVEELNNKNKELSKKMEVLRMAGNSKSYQYREYMGMKLTNSRVLTMLEEYKII